MGGDPPIVFIIFGIVFIMAGIGSAIYNYKNAFGKNRISEYDIVEPGEEEISERLGASSSSLNYCPYCGKLNRYGVTSVASSPDGRYALSGSGDGTVGSRTYK